MQLKSLVVAAALLSNFASLTYGRAIDLPGSDISTTNLPGTAPVHYEIESRGFTGARKKIADKLKALMDRKKKNPNDTGGAGASDDVPLMPVPARYAGPTPLGMDQGPELSQWNKFLDEEVKAQPPPASGGYLMYSGDNLRAGNLRQDFKDAGTEDPEVGYLKDWDDTYGNTPAKSMWASWEQENPTKRHMTSLALSFGQARRAANSKSEIHMLFGSKDEPLMKEKSYWGAVEAGIITGPDSKVNKIWRYNHEDVKKGEPLPPKILAWDRSLHAPFGKKTGEIDWSVSPKRDGAPDGKLDEAQPL